MTTCAQDNSDITENKILKHLMEIKHGNKDIDWMF